MKLVIHPAVENDRLEKIILAAAPMEVVNTSDEAAAAQAIVDADAFFGKLTPQLLSAAGRLRWVQTATASLEHYMFAELIAHPLTLTNMRGLYSDVIADHVMGFVISFARNFHHYIRQQATAHWASVGGETERSDFVSGPGTVSAIDRAHLHLADATLGVVGLGQIGAEIARRAAAFGMRVIAVDPLRKDAPPEVAWLGPIGELPRLLADSDFVVIAAPHTPETAKMFGRRQFQQMKRSAYLINIGRGAIVDLTDLTASLTDGEIAGAGLDVFEIEPLPADHPLWRMPNVIITPHMAGASPRIAQRHLDVLLDNIRRFKAGQPLINVVDKASWF